MAATIREGAPYREFAERLTRLRTEAGLTRAQLGEKIGVAGRSIINYENGERIPYGDVCARMAEVFGITTDELLGVENPEFAMAQAEAMDQMRSLNGKKGSDRLMAVLAEAKHLAGGELTESQLQEYSMELTKLTYEANQRLREIYSNKRYQDTVEAKAEETRERVKAIDAAISEMTSPN